MSLFQSKTPPAEDTLLECVPDPHPNQMETKQEESDCEYMLEDIGRLLTNPEELIAELAGVYSPRRQGAILSQHGYEYLCKIDNTLQGELYKAKSYAVNTNPSYSSRNIIKEASFVLIKKTDKKLYSERITVDDEANVVYCVYEDALKEAKILRHLTDSKNAQYVTKFKQLFETDMDYYLVTEHVEGSMNMQEFVDKAYELIHAKKMKYRHYVTIIKYVFWQLFVAIHWLHGEMKC